jgi:uncharacterized membrane-anchored protein YhcB (DUF1043 family)
MAIEWIVGIAVASLLVGLGLGYILPLGSAKKARVSELEAALETAHQELSDYKGEVYNQFAQTAEKFRNLDRSYQDLHQQLAASSVSLCGDAATPLLVGASLGEGAEALADQEDLVAEELVDEEAGTQASSEPTADVANKLEDDILEDDIVVAETPVELSNEVPTLTEIDADFAPDLTPDKADAIAEDTLVEELDKRERA